MKPRIVLALRHKIAIAFTLLLVGGMVFAGHIYKRHYVIQEKLNFVEEADDLVNNVLEIRRYEKNFFLYGEKENFDLLLSFLTEVEKQIQSLSVRESKIISPERLDIIRNQITAYHRAITDYDAKKHGPVAGRDPDSLNALADNVREIGRSLTENLVDVVKGERQHINELVAYQKSYTFFLLSVFFFLSVIVGYYLFFLVISPLSEIEKAAKQVIGGSVSEIPSYSGSSEIHSLITVLNRMIRELDKKSEQLVQREKMAALGTLTSGVAHELNNPLSNISSSAQILLEELDDSDPEFQKGLLTGIEEQVERARDIVRSLLEFAREKEFEPVATDIGELIKTTVKLVRSEVPPMVDIKIDVPEPVQLEVDRRRLSQALMNLILNGIQAMEDVGGTLTIRAGLDPKGKNLSIEVIDEGMGIPEENLAKVFNPFFSTKETGSGTGLGLYVTYGIIQKHQGGLEVFSEPGQGAKFVITLPLKHAADNHG